MANKMRIRGPQGGPYAAWVLLVLLVGLTSYAFWYNSEDRSVDALSYTAFLDMIDQNNVQSANVIGRQVHGTLKNGRHFETVVVPTDNLWTQMRQHGVDIRVQVQEPLAWIHYLFLLLLIVAIVAAFFFLRQLQGGGGSASGKIFSVGKSRARFFSPNSINVFFKDVAGAVEAKEELQDIVEFLKSPERFERLGAKIPRGILLSGAPGNGKTLLAKAVAGEANCPFFSISGSDFVEVFVGVGASRVRDLFSQARKHAPCIVFIDEIDAVGRQRGAGIGGGNDEREQTLNQLLAEMDGFSTEPGAVIVLAATNRPDVLDKALLRPGRFDRVVEVPYPDVTSRQLILQVHAKNVKLDTAVDLTKIARGTPGFTGADLRNLINEAALAASKANKERVHIEDFEMARDKLLLGAERRTMVMSDEDKKRTAYHEAGHTLLNILLPAADPFHKVTIIPRGRALGVSWSLPEGDRHSQTRAQMVAQVMVCLGGYLAETIIYDESTSGVANDLEKATAIVQSMVRRYGMSELGPITFGSNQEHLYLGREAEHQPDYSENTAQRIDQQIQKIISNCRTEAEKMLQEHIDKLHLLAQTLKERETLPAAEVYELLGIKPREAHSFMPATES